MFMTYVVDNRGMPMARRFEVSDFIWRNMQKNVTCVDVAKANYTILSSENGVILGVGLIYNNPENRAVNIRSLCVKRERRNLGIGAELLTEAKEHARSIGIAEIELYVEIDNFGSEYNSTRLQNWYMRHGFQTMETTDTDIKMKWSADKSAFDI